MNGGVAGCEAARRQDPDTRLLDTSTNYVEHPELVAQRICQFADIVGRERVIAGTDCGFGTFAGYGIDPASVQEARRHGRGRSDRIKGLWGRASARLP